MNDQANWSDDSETDDDPEPESFLQDDEEIEIKLEHEYDPEPTQELNSKIKTPRTWNDVDNCEYRDEFTQASIDEMQSLLDQGTFEYVDLPPGRKAIRCK